jgi:hypothetical protein
MKFTIKLSEKANLIDLKKLEIIVKDWIISKSIDLKKFTVYFTMKNTTPIHLYNAIATQDYVDNTFIMYDKICAK